MRRFAILTSLALFSACSTAPGPQPVGQNPGAPAPPAQTAPAAKPAAPAGTSEASAEAPTQPLDEKVAATKAAYDRNPTDTAARAAYADATFQNAQFYMYNSPLPPGQKYPKALALYREAVKLDPSNDAAREAITTIEDIYRSLGRPVPQV